MKPKGLGRGLDALLSGAPVDPDQLMIQDLALGDIDPNRGQPRKLFDEQALNQLADSIRQAGVLQPILVCPKDGRYQIIAGERRWRAARLAGLDTIPAIVREDDDVRRMEIALIENLQREDLNPMEAAAAVRALMDECGLTQEAVAQRLGRSRPAVANLLRLLTLPPQVQEWVIQGLLSAGHARTLAGIESRTRQIALAQQTIDEGWSVRKLEQMAAQKEPAPRKTAPKLPPPELGELENRMREAFGLRASVHGTLHRGKIVLEYFSAEELEQLYALVEEMRG